MAEPDPGLLVRRNPTDGDFAYFTVWCPTGTTLEKLVQVEGTRWRIEEGFRTAKNEFGLDHNETRSWHGWHRHVSLVMLAYALMAGVRAEANARPPKKTIERLPGLIRWSIQEIRRLIVRLTQQQISLDHILHWSRFRRTHQAVAYASHLKKQL